MPSAFHHGVVPVENPPQQGQEESTHHQPHRAVVEIQDGGQDPQHLDHKIGVIVA
ncbi:MAG: hypothetical protein ACOY3F_12395 [Bacillota bacterium]